MINQLQNEQRVEVLHNFVDFMTGCPYAVSCGDILEVDATWGSMRVHPVGDPDRYTIIYRPGMFDLTGLVKVIDPNQLRKQELKAIMARATKELLAMEED